MHTSKLSWKQDAGSNPGSFSFVSEDGQRHGFVRFDGCVHYFMVNLTDADTGLVVDEDYIHLCNLDEEIERLTLLRAEALQYFGAEWPR